MKRNATPPSHLWNYRCSASRRLHRTPGNNASDNHTRYSGTHNPGGDHRSPSLPLPGTWTLISTLGGRGVSNVLPGTTITAIFAKDGTVSGSAGCNKYVASYNSGVNMLTIGTLVTTPMTCDSPTGIMNQEQIFLTNLQGTATFTITGDLLSISDTNGKTLLTFRKEGAAVSPLPFAGIPWELVMYKGSAGSMIGANPHTTVNALFGADGNITGSAGCNSYAGSYTHHGQNGISIGPLATTLMYLW